MLPRRHRIRTSDDFSTTLRSGARIGGRNIVVSARVRDDISPATHRMGLIVSKAVGNAVTRKKVSRWLREASREIVTDTPDQTRSIDYVIRALPASATSDFHSLRADLLDQAERAVDKFTAHQAAGHKEGRTTS